MYTVYVDGLSDGRLTVGLLTTLNISRIDLGRRPIQQRTDLPLWLATRPVEGGMELCSSTFTIVCNNTRRHRRSLVFCFLRDNIVPVRIER